MTQPEASESPSSRVEGLLAEAQGSLGGSANTLRGVRTRYREHHLAQLARWESLRRELAALERRPTSGNGRSTRVGGADPRLRALRREVTDLGADVGRERTELARIDLALKVLENAWVFLKRGDASLVTDASQPASSADLQMRIVEAQESERARLAQEVHDGPAQALSNAIFQVEFIERVLGPDPALATAELHHLRELLRRELTDVRAFISDLRPPLLVELGLDGAIRDTAERMTDLIGRPVAVELEAPVDQLREAAQTVVLRVVQEALQNVRKHAGASTISVAATAEGPDLVVQIRDDGRGFDTGAVAAQGRRNFGLQFMRERAELIGAGFEVRSRPDGGTVVRLVIPEGAQEA